MFIFIAGGGLLGRALAATLVKARHEVLVVDLERTVCEDIYAKLGVVAVNGSATDIEVLEDSGLQKAEVAAALMRNDADNLAFAILAKHFEVPRVMVRMRNPKYEAAYRLAGVDKIINIVGLHLQQLTLEIEQPEIKQLATFGAGKAAIVTVRLPAECRRDGLSVAEIAGSKDFPEDCVIAGIFREETAAFIIPRGNQRVKSGDEIFLAAGTEALRKAAAFFGIKGKIKPV